MDRPADPLRYSLPDDVADANSGGRAPPRRHCLPRAGGTANNQLMGRRFQFSLQAASPMDAVVEAKSVLRRDEAVLFGIFGIIGGSRYFPPREFLNEFLMSGSDPCDQDGRMAHWQPFGVSPMEYDVLKAWWAASHPGAVTSDLGVGSWDDWVQVILNPEDWGFHDGVPRSE